MQHDTDCQWLGAWSLSIIGNQLHLPVRMVRHVDLVAVARAYYYALVADLVLGHRDHSRKIISIIHAY